MKIDRIALKTIPVTIIAEAQIEELKVLSYPPGQRNWTRRVSFVEKCPIPIAPQTRIQMYSRPYSLKRYFNRCLKDSSSALIGFEGKFFRLFLSSNPFLKDNCLLQE